MKENIVTFQVAKLAKEKGFKELCSHYYFNDGEFKEHEVIEDRVYYGDEYSINLEAFNEDWNNKFVTTKDGDRCFGCNNNKDYFETFSAPTQALLQKWLREKHDIFVVVSPHIYKGSVVFMLTVNQVISAEEFPHNYARMYSGTYEEAFEEGLQVALRFLKK